MMLELISALIIPEAYAQAGDPAGGGGFRGIVPLIIIFAVFFFLVIRPQQKKLKQHQSMVQALKRGDKIVTGGGLIGTVTKVDDEAGILDVDLGSGNIVKVVQSTISDIHVRSVSEEKKVESKSKAKKK